MCCDPRDGGGGGTLIFSHIRTLGPFWGVQILNFNIYFFFFGGGGRKNEYFWKILWIFLGVITKLVIMCILGSFAEVNVQNGDFFGVAKISNILGYA